MSATLSDTRRFVGNVSRNHSEKKCDYVKVYEQFKTSVKPDVRGDTTNRTKVTEAMHTLCIMPEKEEIQKMIPDVDDDGAGTTSDEELLRKMTHKIPNSELEVEIPRAFRLFDENASGEILFKNLKCDAEEHGERMIAEKLCEMVDEVDEYPEFETTSRLEAGDRRVQQRPPLLGQESPCAPARGRDAHRNRQGADVRVPRR